MALLQLIQHFRKIMNGHHTSHHVEYNPQKIETILREFNKLSRYISNLENSLQVAENKKIAYEDMLHKYEKIVDQEIMLYELHKSNFLLLNQTVNENEAFIKELHQQIKSFLNSGSNPETKNDKITSFKRILSRFVHQNEVQISRIQQRLTELDEMIEHKNRLLERMYFDVKSCCSTSYFPAEQLSSMQACNI